MCKCIAKIVGRRMRKPLILLHLSDIHFGRNRDERIKESDFSHKESILDQLIECIIQSEYKPDHIVFTGDIAWKGKAEEFDEAYEWFSKLLSGLNLSGKDITFCPGNHDVNRNYLNYNRDITTKNIPSIDEIYEYKNIFKMESPKENYNKFCGRLGVVPFHYPIGNGFESSFSLGFKDIGDTESGMRLYSFDTSLLSSVKDVRDDNMFLGQPQIIDLIQNGLCETDRYKVALFHHAERFLHPNEICEYDNRPATLPLLREHMDILLCGHTETGGKPILYKQDNGAYTLTSGAAYYDDDHPNAFSFIEVIDKKIKLYPFSCSSYQWKPYKYEQTYNVERIRKLKVPFAKLEGPGMFGISSGEHGNYETAINEFALDQNNNDIATGNNLDDPNRFMDIVCSGPTVNPGTATFTVGSPRIYANSVSAAVKLEEFYQFMDSIKENDGNKFYMKNMYDTVFFSGDNVKCNVETQDVQYYKDLLKIEQYFDIRFIRPDELKYEEDETTKCLLDYIEQGYAIIPSVIDCSAEISEKEKFTAMLEQDNNLYLLCEDEFSCVLHGALISFKGLIVSGPYDYDKEDCRRKAETFMEGDKRVIQFNLSEGGKTYLVNKDADGSLQLLEPFEFIYIGNMKLKWLLFSEKDKS